MLLKKFAVAAFGIANLTFLTAPQTALAHNDRAAVTSVTDDAGAPKAKPVPQKLSDYRKPDFTTKAIDLNIDIRDDYTRVHSDVTYTLTAEGAKNNVNVLILNTDDPNEDGDEYLRFVKADGEFLAPGQGYFYDRDKKELRIPLKPGQTTLRVEIDTRVSPDTNKDLKGLYVSGGLTLTQNEHQGFRRITPYLDRPDVLAVYTVRIEANKADYPILLSNGDQTGAGDAGHGRHWVSFHDSAPKPSYLFATVNGKMDVITDNFTTADGRDIKLYVYTLPGKAETGRHSMESLKQSMKWDEETFGAIYDIDEYKIVAVPDFAAGAMENKGLNVFRETAALATPTGALDGNYRYVLEVTGHEYFHNWSGNRITVANWFMLTQKEGLTTAREEMFSESLSSEGFARINKADEMRNRQFPVEDGKRAHPVMPNTVEDFDDIYGSTIYGKGAEVYRMVRTIMGDQTFNRAMRHYFKSEDGNAVTVGDFVKRMEESSGINLSGQFMLWFTDIGRPRVEAQGVYDAAAKTYTLTMTQTIPDQGGNSTAPRMIPVVTALVDRNGDDIPLYLNGDSANAGKTEQVLLFKDAKQSFVFRNVESEPEFHSIFRSFSAPVTYDDGLSADQLHSQIRGDNNAYTRWDAAQRATPQEFKRLYDYYSKHPGVLVDVDKDFIEALRAVARDPSIDMAVKAQILNLPTIDPERLYDTPVDIVAATKVKEHMLRSIATRLNPEFRDLYLQSQGSASPYVYNYAEEGRRALRNVAVENLTILRRDEDEKFLLALRDMLKGGNYNLTDDENVLRALRHFSSAARDAAVDDYLARHKGLNETRVSSRVWTWHLLQTRSESADTLDRLRRLVDAGRIGDGKSAGDDNKYIVEALKNFTLNDGQFHRADGAGYRFMADMIRVMDSRDPKLAAALVPTLADTNEYTANVAARMRAALDNVRNAPGVSDELKSAIDKAAKPKEPAAKISYRYTLNFAA